jgi:hypothetical protein
MTARVLPPEPYLGLAQYGAEQSLLFTGRDAHVDQCAEIIAQSDTKILLLHGQTACGKSSFLRAGLIPALEDSGFGYAFVRRPPPATAPANSEGRPVFVRCGRDPLESLALDLYEYISAPVLLRTAQGPVPFDLGAAKLECPNAAAFVRKCRDPYRMLEVLNRISEPLVHSIVLVMDQMEEVLTLNPVDSDNRTRLFTFLKLFNNSTHKVKLILSLRKDHSGEFIGLAQIDNTARTEFKVYLLPEMSRSEVLRSILLPTSDEELSDEGSPFSKYRFRYAEGIAERLVDKLFGASSRGGVLPVMQIVCRDLYDAVRRGPQPWIISPTLYDDKRVENCIRRHVTGALREPLRSLSLSDSALREAERAWRKVLFLLIRYEGDGRVSTSFMSKQALRNQAEQDGAPHFDGMINHLAKPEVLVLRNVTVQGAGFEAEEAMLGLGHDVVGLALNSLRIEDGAIQRAEQRRRQRTLASAAAAGGILLIVGLFAAANLREHYLQFRENIDDATAFAKGSYREDANRALIAARLAAARTFGVMRLAYTQRAEQVAQEISAALPFATLPLAPADDAEGTRVHSLLQSTPGVISVSPSGVIEIRTLDPAQARFVSGDPLRIPGEFELSRNAYLSSSEPFPGQILLLISAPYSGGQDGDRDFRVYLVRVDEGQVKGPFGGSFLLNKFDVIRYRDTGSDIRPLRRAFLSGVSLGGDVVSLTANTSDRRFVVSLLLNREPVDDYFTPAVNLAMEVPRSDITEIEMPRMGRQLIVGGRLFSAQYTAMKRAIDLPPRPPEVVEGTPLRADGQASAADAKPWRLPLAQIPAVADCNRQGPYQCIVTLLPREGRLQVLRLVSLETLQDGIKEGGASYVVIDSESGKYQEITGETIERARKGCELFAGQPGTGPTGSPAIPAFELGQLDDLLFAYQMRSAIQFVRIRNGQASCTERLLPDAERPGPFAGPPGPDARERTSVWRFLPDQDLVLALNSRKAMAWNIGEVRPASK